MSVMKIVIVLCVLYIQCLIIAQSELWNVILKEEDL